MGTREMCCTSMWIILILLSCVDKTLCAVTGESISGPSGISEGSPVPVTLTCSATCSNGTCKFSWLQSNVVEQSSNSTHSIASIASVNRTNAGTYECNVVDGDGETKTARYVLAVYYGPDAVTLNPPALLYTLNEATDTLGPIDCSGHNCSRPEMCTTVWTYPDGSRNVSSTTSSQLTILHVERKHSGTFTCTGINSGTNITKLAQVNVTVNYGPDAVNLTDTSKSVIEGSSYIANCTCQTCEPGCSVEWIFKEQKEGQNGVLQFKNVSRRYHGQHNCKCTNSAAPEKTRSKYLALNVQYPPDVNITWNQNTKTLNCTADGNPATYTFSAWRQQVGRTIVRPYLSGNTENDMGNTLILDGAHPYMETGRYICSVSNNIGDYTGTKIQTKEITVTIPDGPVLLESQAEYNVSKGSNVTMTAIIYADPPVTPKNVSVRHSNDTISLKGITVLLTVLTQVTVPFYNTNAQVNGIKVMVQIAEVKEEYFGDIIVEMRNGIGLKRTTISLNPQGSPDTPSNISYTPDVNSVTFKLKPGFFNGANQTFYVEYSTNRNASVWNNDTFVEAGFLKADTYFKEVTVHGLQPETSYNFRLKGVNMYGESAPTEIFEIKTLKEPLNVAAIAGGAAAGAAVVVVIIVIVICVLKRRGNSSKKSNKPVQMHNILDVSTSDQAPIIARSPYTNNNTGATNSVVYENTFSEEPEIIATTPSSPKEHIYGNTDINADGHQTSPFQYYNVSDNTNTSAASLEINRQESTEPHYSNYSNQSKSNESSKETEKEQNQDDDENIEISGEQPYLEMELGKGPSKTEEPYLEMEVQRNGKDYINVEKYKKSKNKRTEPKKSDGLQNYESMHERLKKRESMPDYVAPPPPKADVAPPPPQADEEDYMNVQMSRRS